MSLTYSINGYPLPNSTQREGMWLLAGTEYAPGLAPRNATLEVPTAHDEIPDWQGKLPGLTVGLQLRLRSSSANGLRTLHNRLTGLLGLGTNSPVQLQRIRGTHTDLADAKLVSTTAPEYLHVARRMDTEVIFSIPGGAWRGNAQIDQNFSNGEDLTITAAQSSTRPITDALLRVRGPLTVVDVTDVVSGTGIRWGGGTQVVGSSSYLLISPRLMRARIVGSETWNIDSGVAASASLVFTGMGPLTLTPRRSGPSASVSSGLTVSMTGGSGPMTVRARTAVV